jgi:hypothetical protein
MSQLAQQDVRLQRLSYTTTYTVLVPAAGSVGWTTVMIKRMLWFVVVHSYWQQVPR